jgi:hypothetical protein
MEKFFPTDDEFENGSWEDDTPEGRRHKAIRVLGQFMIGMLDAKLDWTGPNGETIQWSYRIGGESYTIDDLKRLFDITD